MRAHHVIAVCAAVSVVATGAGIAAAATDGSDEPSPMPLVAAPIAAAASPASAADPSTLVCGDVPIPTWVPPEVVGQPRVTCGDADPARQDEWLRGQLGGTCEVPAPPVLPYYLNEVAYDIDWDCQEGALGPGLDLTVYEDTDQLVNEELPGARQVELADGVTARLTTSDNGLGATRLEWVTAGHSYLLLGSRVVLPDGDVAGPVADDLVRMAASTL